MKPTQGQIKEFLEGYGFKFVMDLGYDYRGEEWEVHYPDGEWHHAYKTEISKLIDLNNLFKYAVPKLYKKYTHLDILFEHGVHGNITTNCTIKFSNYITRQMEVIGKGEAYDKDPALALFWALWQVKEDKNETGIHLEL